MTVPEALEKFRNGVINEIVHSSVDADQRDSLMEAVKKVELSVLASYEQSKK